MHVKTKDLVVVLTGKAKGSRGTVLSVDRQKGRAIVERVNMMKKHTRANPTKGVQGGIVEREAPVDVSNLMLVCPQCSEPTRVLVRVDGSRRVRTCRRCDQPMDK